MGRDRNEGRSQMAAGKRGGRTRVEMMVHGDRFSGRLRLGRAPLFGLIQISALLVNTWQGPALSSCRALALGERRLEFVVRGGTLAPPLAPACFPPSSTYFSFGSLSRGVTFEDGVARLLLRRRCFKTRLLRFLSSHVCGCGWVTFRRLGG